MIREVLAKCEELIVVIGSAEESHTVRNPFTAGERFQMILSSLSKAERTRVLIVPIRDVNRYSVWVGHLESYLPPFDLVFSNSRLTQSLFRQAGYEVKKTKAYNPKSFSATEIRRRIIAGGRWTQLVPEPVARLIEGMDGKERLLAAASDACKGRGSRDVR